MMCDRYDVIIVGGGLAGGMLAYLIQLRRPEIRYLLLEQGSTLGGKHTWSFHRSDVSSNSLAWLSTLVEKSWDSYEVRFPGGTRTLKSGYFSIRSDKFHQVIREHLGASLSLGQRISRVSRHQVETEEGAVFDADCVIDARGFLDLKTSQVGFQKFFGLEVELSEPHRLEGPILMDATCRQIDGFRFFYVLPWSPCHLLIEDTRYSDDSEIDDSGSWQAIHDYASQQGWTISRVLGQEKGALPLPFTSLNSKRAHSPIPSIGTRAGFFHPTTGYSLPNAVRIAEKLVESPLTNTSILETLHATSRKEEKGRAFFRMLNRMLFRGAVPEKRYRILERFYQLKSPLINRFYSSQLNGMDLARILIGRPPISLWAALRCLREPREVTGG